MDLITHPSPPQDCCQAPSFIVIKEQPPRIGPDVPSARPEKAQEAQRKPASGQQSAPPRPAKKPSSAHSPGGKRKIHGPGPKLATAPTDAKRTPAAGGSQASGGPQPGSRPPKTRTSPGTAPAACSDSVAKRVAHGPSSQKFHKEFGGKAPPAVRQRYFGLFAEECLKFCSSPLEALKRAWAEEKVIFDRSPSKNAYLHDAGHMLRALRGPAPRALPGLSQAALYSRLRGYLLTEDQRKANGYPFPDAERPGRAVLFTAEDKAQRPHRRTCCRCGIEYPVSPWGLCARPERCYYHWGRPRRTLEACGWQNQYTCCSAAVGSVGCQVARQHVHDGRKEDLRGFVKTAARAPSPDAHPGIYALDCEMSFTTHGLELTRVTVVDADLRVVYDTFVKPDREIVDYNTRFSGVTEADLARTSVTLRDVQAFLLSMLSADSILVGHSLESDLLVLKMIHPSVVDTSVLFPHPLGLPYKRSLRSLVADYLCEIIQDKPAGHSSREDASACMRLVGWKVMEDAARTSWDPGSPPLPPPLAPPAAWACPWSGSPPTGASAKPARCTAAPVPGNPDVDEPAAPGSPWLCKTDARAPSAHWAIPWAPGASCLALPDLYPL